MFGMRGLKKVPRLDLADAAVAPYSRFTQRTPEIVQNHREHSRFQPVAGTTRRRPAQTVQTPVEAPETASHPLNLTAELYSDAPIPVSVLRRALPQRFKTMAPL